MDECDSESDDDDELLLLSMKVTVKWRFLSILLVVLVHELAGYLYLIRAT